ncbi:MAG: hypothetical protein ACK4WJ_02140 [Endomicrobiia bacterium]
MRKIIYFLITIFFVTTLYALEITSYGVDGSSNNLNVMIKNRNPVLFFEYRKNNVVTHYEIKLATSTQGLTSANTIWYLLGSTTTENTINYIVREEIPASLLSEQTTYFLLVLVYDILGYTETINDKFFTTKSAVSLAQNISLEIDYNNPFCPKNGEITKIRYVIKEKDFPVKVYIFTISGKPVRKLVDSVAIKDMVYTVDWDGRNDNGEIVSKGLYVVSLIVEDNPSVTRFIAVVDK